MDRRRKVKQASRWEGEIASGETAGRFRSGRRPALNCTGFVPRKWQAGGLAGPKMPVGVLGLGTAPCTGPVEKLPTGDASELGRAHEVPGCASP